MVTQAWGNLEGWCISCGKRATHWFIKKWFFGKQELKYCKECLRKRLKAEKIELKGINK